LQGSKPVETYQIGLSIGARVKASMSRVWPICPPTYTLHNFILKLHTLLLIGGVWVQSLSFQIFYY